MDKFEDNCVENEQNHISQLASPLMPWIEHICQPPFSSANFGDEAKLLMHAVLEAMQNIEDYLAEGTSLSKEVQHTSQSLAAATETARIMRNQYNGVPLTVQLSQDLHHLFAALTV